MQKLRRWVEKVYDRRITNDYDDMVLVIADEGDGKSNTMLALIHWYQAIRGLEPDVESVLDALVWSKSEYETAMAEWEKQSVICAMDAARIAHKKKAMHPDQIEFETDLFDVRMKQHLQLLGFQEWDTVPSSLQDRRAQHALYIPRRGVVWGYNRDSLDDRAASDDWPEPDLVDTMPFLGNVEPMQDLWEAFESLDEEKKIERIRSGDDDADPEDVERREAIKTALRATKPWDDDAGMTYREAAALVEYSKGWVGERVQEWRAGEHRELLDVEDSQTAGRRGVAG